MTRSSLDSNKNKSRIVPENKFGLGQNFGLVKILYYLKSYGNVSVHSANNCTKCSANLAVPGLCGVPAEPKPCWVSHNWRIFARSSCGLINKRDESRNANRYARSG